MSDYVKTIGRLGVALTDNGAVMHGYGYGCSITCVDGWNDSCPTVRFTLAVEELRDLRYLLDRAIAVADESARKRARP